MLANPIKSRGRNRVNNKKLEVALEAEGRGNSMIEAYTDCPAQRALWMRSHTAGPEGTKLHRPQGVSQAPEGYYSPVRVSCGRRFTNVMENPASEVASRQVTRIPPGSTKTVACVKRSVKMDLSSKSGEDLVDRELADRFLALEGTMPDLAYSERSYRSSTSPFHQPRS